MERHEQEDLAEEVVGMAEELVCSTARAFAAGKECYVRSDPQ